MANVFIPPLLQKLTHGQTQVEIEGETVREIIANLETRFVGFKDRICEDDRIKPMLAVAVDGEFSSEGLRTKVRPDSEVHFLPALSGG